MSTYQGFFRVLSPYILQSFNLDLHRFMCYIYSMETPTINIVGKKRDFLSCAHPHDKTSFAFVKLYGSPNNRNPKYFPQADDERTRNLKVDTQQHRYGCQCEDCENELYYNLDFLRT